EKIVNDHSYSQRITGEESIPCSCRQKTSQQVGIGITGMKAYHHPKRTHVASHVSLPGSCLEEEPRSDKTIQEIYRLTRFRICYISLSVSSEQSFSQVIRQPHPADLLLS